MAKRQYKTRVPFANTLDKKIFEELKEFSSMTKIPKSKILDMAIKQYIESYKKDKA